MKCNIRVGLLAFLTGAFVAGGALAQDASGGGSADNSAPPSSAPAGAPAAGMDHPCQDDIAKLCPDAKTRKDRMQCMRDNKEKLSDACKERLAKVKEKVKEKREEFRDACKDDVAKYCADVKGRPRMVLGCLMGNQDRLSDACGQKVAKMKEWRNKHRGQGQSGGAAAPAPESAPASAPASGGSGQP